MKAGDDLAVVPMPLPIPASFASQNLAVRPKGWPVSVSASGRALRRAFSILAATVGVTSFAQTIWIGSSGANWNTSSNWKTGAVPNNKSTSIAFNDIAAGAYTLNVDLSPTVNYIYFGSAATNTKSRYTLQGSGSSRTITINGGITSASDVAQTFSSTNLQLKLAASSIFSASGAGSLTINAPVNLNSYDLTLSGSGTGNIGGAISGSTSTTITKSGTGTWGLSGASSSFGGTINITAGTLIASAANALGNSSADTVVSSGAALGLSGGITTASVGTISLAGTGVNNSGALYNVGGNNILTTGNLILSGSTTIAATAGNLTLSGPINTGSTLTSDAKLTFATANGTTINVTGKIADPGSYALGLALTGNGILSFGSSDYYGNTTIGTAGGVTTGTLRLTASGALPVSNSQSVVTVYSGTLDLNNYNATSYGSLVLGGGGSGSTAIITTGTGTLTLNGNLTYDATNNPNGATLAGKLALAKDVSNGSLNTHTFTVGDSAATNNDLTISANISDASGAGSGNIVKAGTGTLVLTGTNSYTGTTNITTGTVQIGNGGTAGSIGTGAVTIASGANLAINLTGTGASAFTLANAISGTGSILQSGTGTTILSGNSASFGGNTNVTTGALVAANANALGNSTANVTVGSGAALGLRGNITLAAGNLTLNGTGLNGSGALYSDSGSNTVAGNIYVASDTTINASTGNLTLGKVYLSANALDSTLTLNADTGRSIIASGLIDDHTNTYYRLNLGFTGSGNLTLSDASGFYGNITVGAANGSSTGTLLLGASGALPSRNSSANLTIYSGTLDLNNYDATAYGNIVLGGGASGSVAAIKTGTGTLTLNHDLTYDATNSPNGATISGNILFNAGAHTVTIGDSSAAVSDLTISGNLTDLGSASAASIYKYGNGTLTLSGNNSYTGLMSIQTGVVSVQSNNALGSSSTAAAYTTVRDGSSLQLSGANLSIAERLILAGQGYNGNGALWNSSGNNVLSGNITLNTANTRIQTDTGSSLTLTASTLYGNSTAGGSLEVGGAGTLKVSSNIANSVGAITKKDGGTLVLAGSNSYTGPLSVQAGTVSVQNNNALSNQATTVSGGATLAFDSSSNGNLIVAGQPAGSTLTIDIAGTGVGGAGAIRNTGGNNSYTGNLTMSGSSLITANAGTSLALNGGMISGAGSTLTFGSSSSVSGTGLNGNIAVGSTLSGMNLVKNGSGNLTVQGGGSVGTVNVNQGKMVVQSSTLNTGSLTVAASTSLLIASGGVVNVTGSASFASGTLSGSTGTLQVNGNNTLTFNGTISAPSMTLVLNGGSRGTNASPLTVNLSGANITVGSIVITGDTILDFGNSAGTTLSSLNLDVQNGAKVTVVGWMSTVNQATQSTIWSTTGTVNSSSLGTSNQTSSTNTDLGQITFSNPTGSTGNTTTWVADTSSGWFDHEIRPTPEPATYGLIMASGCLGVLGWRQRQRRKVASRLAR